MKALKNLGIGLFFIVLALVIVAFFLPKTVHVKRSVLIKANPAVVFNQINDLYNWEKWAPCYQLDSAIDVRYFGNEEGEGAGYEWKSDNAEVGSGSLVIVGSKPFDSISIEMDFVKGGKALTYFLFSGKNDSTNLCWSTKFNLGNNPVRRYIGLFMKKKVENSYEKALSSIKMVSERENSNYEMKIELTRTLTFNYLGIQEKIKITDMALKIGEYFGELLAFINLNKLKQTKSPFAIYHSFSKDETDIEVCIPVDKESKGKGRIRCGKFDERNAVVAYYYGSYNNLSKAHKALQAWISEYKKKVIGSPWEEYVTDPVVEKDSTKWLTRVYYPVE